MYACCFLRHQTTASADSTITISPSKAKELSINEGDVVMVIGRRRRAAYARVHVSKKGKTGACTISANLASNLRLRNGDKAKLASLTSAEDKEHRTGDMLLFRETPKKITSVTFSPIEDSLASLESSEGEILDDEIMERFVTPYLNLEEQESHSLLKKGHFVTMTDDNGKSLDFVVTHVELEGTDQEDEEEGKISVFRQAEVAVMLGR